jgi:hypothetical protein
MAKRKNKKDGRRSDADAQALVRKGITGGAVAGAATYLAGKVVETVVDKAVSAGCDRIWGGRPAGRSSSSSSTSSCGSAAPDLGLEILKTLAGRVQPIPVFRLAGILGVDLLTCVEAVAALRRVRMIKYGSGRRTAQLTGLGREALLALTSPEEPEPMPEPAAALASEPEPTRDERSGEATHEAGPPDSVAADAAPVMSG